MLHKAMKTCIFILACVLVTSGEDDNGRLHLDFDPDLSLINPKLVPVSSLQLLRKELRHSGGAHEPRRDLFRGLAAMGKFITAMRSAKINNTQSTTAPSTPLECEFTARGANNSCRESTAASNRSLSTWGRTLFLTGVAVLGLLCLLVADWCHSGRVCLVWRLPWRCVNPRRVQREVAEYLRLHEPGLALHPQLDTPRRYQPAEQELAAYQHLLLRLEDA